MVISNFSAILVCALHRAAQPAAALARLVQWYKTDVCNSRRSGIQYVLSNRDAPGSPPKFKNELVSARMGTQAHCVVRARGPQLWTEVVTTDVHADRSL